ncbi:AAA family ATPase [Cryptosporangium sp. NPDC051539]|uniref:AAA family ATPase n=1 Tax=Cryptosporangium sp. NPDC051539 TaxID=3363962 RepID=UPI00379D2ADD
MQGRLEERQLLETFQAVVQDGRSGALVLVGEAGIGKTRLLDEFAAGARGVRLTRTAGSESETHLGFAGLQRLLRPFMDRLERLPGPQRTALATAFGLISGTAPDLFLVGLAALTLLADVATDLPLICLVDDAQWLDQESLAALAFLGRRLEADSIGLLVGVREEARTLTVLQGLRTHTIAGLNAEEAHALVASRAPGRLEPRVLERLVRETQGNPLALIEATAALSAEQRAGGAVLPRHLPIGRRLEAHFAGQAAQLPAGTRLLLLLVAAAPAEDQALLWRAADRLELAPTALDPAVEAGILQGHAFRHPLIRAAVYSSAAPAERRVVHGALAEATHPDHDPDNRAWHRAESVVGLDDAVADALEQASERARNRGGYATQAAFLSRAADLTSDPQRRAVRCLAATAPYLQVGDTAAAARRLDQAGPGLTVPALRAAEQRIRAGIEWYTAGVAARAPKILLDALATFGPLDDRTTRAMLWEALTAGLLAGRHTVGVAVQDIARAGMDAPRGEGTLTDVLLDALAVRIAGEFGRAVPLLRNAVAALRTEDLSAVGPITSVGSWAAFDLWDDEGVAAVLTRMDAFHRGQGALQELGPTLYTEMAWEAAAGRFAEAETHRSEADEISAAFGSPPIHDERRVVLLAWQGREDETRAAVDSAMKLWGEQLGYGAVEKQRDVCAAPAGTGAGPVSPGARMRAAAVRGRPAG